MAERHRVGWLVAARAGVCLVLAGCQMTVTWPNVKSYAPSPIADGRQAVRPELIQAGYQGGPVQGMGSGVPLNGSPYPGPMPVGPQITQGGVAPGTGQGQPCGPNGCGGGSGGGTGGDHGGGPPPTELWPTSHPPYRVEPPDILLINGVRLIPKGPYVVQPLDVLIIRVGGTTATEPIDGAFTVNPDGTVNLGYNYGAVRVAGLSLEGVEKAVRDQVGPGGFGIKKPQVAIGLASFRGAQQVGGEHLVRQDGTISLGTYGCLYVTGLTIEQIKVAVERHLSQYLQDPEVSIDVFAYNSKMYYVITDGAGYGQQVFRFPITGKETVLDGISNIGGIPAVGSKKKVWVARPTPPGHSCNEVLPVDWMAITQGGSTATNYQLFPGDRIYIGCDPLICIDNTLAKVLQPIERLLGLTLLGASTYRIISNNNSLNNGSGLIVAGR